MQVLTVAGALLSFAVTASAQTSFFDGDFPGTSWSSLKLVDTTPQPGTMVAVERVTTGGNPSAFRQTTLTAPGKGSVFVAHVAAPANYEPSLQGEFQTIEGEFCLRDFGALPMTDAEYRILIRQNGTYYVSVVGFAAPAGAWEMRSFPRMRSVGFTKVSGPGPINPDFGPTGDFFEIGYSVGIAAADPLASVSGIENWSVNLGFCYADCDESGGLDFFDFLCFQNQFAFENMYADCDGSGGLDFFDFLCFQNQFAFGC